MRKTSKCFRIYHTQSTPEPSCETTVAIAAPATPMPSTQTVSSVATSRPPMIVAAMAPNIESNNRGSIPRIVVPEAIATGTIRLRVAAVRAS